MRLSINHTNSTLPLRLSSLPQVHTILHPESMNNSELHFSQDPRRALQDTSPGPQVVQPSLSRPVPLNPTQLSTNSQQPQQQQQHSQQQQQQTMSPNMGTFSYMAPETQQFSINSTFSNEMQRLQQLQQLGAGQGGMLPQHTHSPHQPNVQQQNQQNQQQQGQQQQGQQQNHQQQQQQQNNNDFLRNLMTQKLPMPSYDDQLRQRLALTAPAEPLLQAPLMDEARFLMNQGGNAMGFGSFGRQPFTLPSPHELTLRDDTRRMRGGVIEPFPEKLHRLLTEVETTGRSDVISFIANGKAFAIHKPDKFFKEVVPKYFRQSRLSSFKRQLNLYGFELINTGPARGGYYHEMFIKERPELCRRMRRVAVKLQTNNKAQEANTAKQTSTEFVYDPPTMEKIMGTGPDFVKGHQMHQTHQTHQQDLTATTTTTTTQANNTFNIQAEEGR